MRTHLASYVGDFERLDTELAIVSYSGVRRRTTTYKELALLAGRFSRLLEQRGLRTGDRVLLWGANSAEWVAAFFGCILRGVIVVPLDAAGTAGFAHRVVRETAPAMAVGDARLLQSLGLPSAPMPFSGFAQQLPPDPLLAPDGSLSPETPLQIIYTSGTTAEPKGVVHTHGNVLASTAVLEHEIAKYRRYERWVHPVRILQTLPLSHVFGQFMGLWVPPLLGSPVYFEDRLAAGHLIQQIHRERISVAAVVPRTLELMRLSLRSSLAGLDARVEALATQPAWKRWWRMRDVHRQFGWKFWAFVSGGATLDPVVETFWNRLGFLLIQGYGMTETTALATLNHPLHPAAGSIGKPLAGREVKLAEDGEILVRGPMLASGLWRNGTIQPSADEWLHTGDLGRFDEHGQLHFLGRKGDVIVAASGMNIYPSDLEAALRQQPEVADCAVVPWAESGSVEPVAVVLLREPHKEVAPETVLAGANARLASYQQMRRIYVWPQPEFPRTSTGKLRRRDIAAWVAQHAGGRPSGAAAGPGAGTDRLRQLLARLTGAHPDTLRDEVLLPAAGIDSLARMQLAIAMEEEFGCAVPDAAIASAQRIGDLRRLLDMPAETAAPATASLSTTPAAEPARVPAIETPRPSYPHWPWSWLVQALRTAFIEAVLRPLVWLLAHPQTGPSVTVPQEPAIYIANHVTAVDVPLVLYALPRRIRDRMAIAMSAELLEQWRRARPSAGVGPGPLRWFAPLQAWLVRALLNVFPLPAGAGLRASFSHAGEALDRGFNVLIFPEGRRSETGDMQSFQTGIALLAEQTGAAVVPVGLYGLGKIQEKQGKFRRKLAVHTGAPLCPKAGESARDFTCRLELAVRHLISMGTRDKTV
jgi:long-chain acyl-CoA synthetase